MAIRRTSHCVYDTRYHLVWAPKYRKLVLQGAIRQRVRELCFEIAGHHRFEIEELEGARTLFICFSVFRQSTRSARWWGC